MLALRGKAAPLTGAVSRSRVRRAWCYEQQREQRQLQQHRPERAAPVVEEERRGAQGAAYWRKGNRPATLSELLAATWEPSSSVLDARASAVDNAAPLVAANSDPFSLGLSQPPQRSSNAVHPRRVLQWHRSLSSVRCCSCCCYCCCSSFSHSCSTCPEEQPPKAATRKQKQPIVVRAVLLLLPV